MFFCIVFLYERSVFVMNIFDSLHRINPKESVPNTPPPTVATYSIIANSQIRAPLKEPLDEERAIKSILEQNDHRPIYIPERMAHVLYFHVMGCLLRWSQHDTGTCLGISGSPGVGKKRYGGRVLWPHRDQTGTNIRLSHGIGDGRQAGEDDQEQVYQNRGGTTR
jgi:hypothetical protein